HQGYSEEIERERARKEADETARKEALEDLAEGVYFSKREAAWEKAQEEAARKKAQEDAARKKAEDAAEEAWDKYRQEAEQAAWEELARRDAVGSSTRYYYAAARGRTRN